MLRTCSADTHATPSSCYLYAATWAVDMVCEQKSCTHPLGFGWLEVGHAGAGQAAPACMAIEANPLCLSPAAIQR